MKLTNLNGTSSQVETNKAIILFSYSTPVAYEDKQSGAVFKTSKKWSATTSKHVSKWLDGRRADLVDQSVLDSLTI